MPLDLKNKKLRYPHIRKTLVDTLKTLSDKNYQKNVWVKKRFPENIKYDCLDITIDFIFDETTLADASEKMIGVILYNHEEVSRIKDVVDSLNMAMDDMGQATDEQYINSKYWPIVISKAQNALGYLQLMDIKEAEG